jgi:hypothetical protein
MNTATIAYEVAQQYQRLSITHDAADTRPLSLEDQNQLCPVEGGWLCAPEGVGLRHDWLDAAKDEAMRHAVSLTEQPEDNLFDGVFGSCFDRGCHETAVAAFYF